MSEDEIYILENLNYYYYSQNAFTIRIALHGHLIRILQFEGHLPCISNTNYEWRGSTTTVVSGPLITALVSGRVTPPNNPLRTKLFFPSIFKISRKIGCYRLPIHRRGTHKNLFMIPSYLKKKKKMAWRPLTMSLCLKGLGRRQCYLLLSPAESAESWDVLREH